MQIDEEGRPKFAPASNEDGPHYAETRKIPIPPHRMTPLRNEWQRMCPPLVEHLKIQVRMNTNAKKGRAVELRTSKHTKDSGALQKGEDFVKAFSLGFDIDDAIALLRLDDLYIETFEIKDVKTLTGEHLSRAIGRKLQTSQELYKPRATNFHRHSRERWEDQACNREFKPNQDRIGRSKDTHHGRLQEHKDC